MLRKIKQKKQNKIVMLWKIKGKKNKNKNTRNVMRKKELVRRKRFVKHSGNKWKQEINRKMAIF